MENKKKDLRDFRPGAFDWSPYFNVISVKKYQDAEFVGNHGGSDVHPSTYGHKNSRSYCSEYQIQRDKEELAMMEYCVKHGIPQFSNCRSFQLLNVLNGGTMIQHVNHGGGHLVDLYNGEKVLTNSIHHQMANPWLPQTGVSKCNIEVLGWTNISNVHIGQDGTELEFEEGQQSEIEIAFFPDLNAFGIQSHVDFGGHYPDLYKFLYAEMLQKLKFLN